MSFRLVADRACARTVVGCALALWLAWAAPGSSAGGVTISYSYDGNGRLSGLTYSDGTTVTYAYDLNGNRTAATVAAGAPTAPTGLAASAQSLTQISLNWGAASAATGSTLAGYKVERCQGAGCNSFSQVGTASGTSYSDSGLAPATAYVYRVRAYTTGGLNSAYSPTASATTLADTTPPSSPANLTASASGPAQINLSWGASTDNIGVAGYKLERCQGAGCGGFAQIATPSGTSYSDTGVANGYTYVYRLRAYDAAGNNSGYSNSASATLADSIPPSVPGGLSASASSWSTVNLSWSASTDNVGVAGYRIYRGGSQIGTSAGNSYSDTTTAPSSSYSYTVSAYDAAGNNSGQSSAASATTPAPPAPSAPTGLAATAVADTQMNLSWSAASDAGGPGLAGYKVYRNGTQIGTTSGTSYSDTGVTAFNTYTYTVAAYDTVGTTSAQSSAVSASTYYQITDGNGNILPAASALYVAGFPTAYPSVYIWYVRKASGTQVLMVATGGYGTPPACVNGYTQSIATGYQRQGCVLYASASAYGH